MTEPQTDEAPPAPPESPAEARYREFGILCKLLEHAMDNNTDVTSVEQIGADERAYTYEVEMPAGTLLIMTVETQR